jgi:MATE family multidrug resistance protein
MAERVIAPEADVAEQARLYFSILIWGAPLVLLNYTVIGWLMGQARTRATLATQVIGNLSNIILDVILVSYWDFGVAGVAVASLLAQASMLGLGLCFVARGTDFSLSHFQDCMRMTSSDIRSIVSTNSDLLLRTASLLVMFNLMTKIGASLGTTVLAGNAVLMQVTFITSYIFDGIANASSVFTGKSVGQGNTNLLAATLRRTNQWTIAAIGIFVFFILIAGTNLGRLFTDIPEVLESYRQIHGWAAVFPVAAGFGLTYYGIFTGSGTTRPVRNSTFFALLTFMAGLASVNLWGNHGLWFSFILFYIGRWAYLLPYLGWVKVKISTRRVAKQAE